MSIGFGNEELAGQLGMHRGLFGGAQEPIQRLDFNFAEGGLGGAFANPMIAMVLQPLINQVFGHGGVMPAQFAPQQGLYDQWRAKQYWQARMTAMTTASQADRETYVRMLRGMAQARGTPWGLEQQRSANVMAQDLAFMAPAMAQAMPELFDLAHGTRGSATVMAQFLHRGGLTGVDPATGRTGITGESAGTLAREMHRRFFGVDPDDLAGWRGLSAGRAGMLYDELQQRGLVGTSIGALTRAEQLRSLTGSTTSRQDAIRLVQQEDPAQFQRMVAAAGPDAAGRTGEDQIRAIARAGDVAKTAIDKIAADQPGQFDALLRQFDATRIGNRLKDMSGAVAAMREIFGDLGRPNAPMSELIQGLNDLTQGGLATMNPAELERTVRSTQVIARTSGMGMQAFQALQGRGARMAMDMGLDPRFGMLASQSAAEFGAAYGQVGGGAAGGWGRADREQMTLLNQQLTLNAAASPMANQLATIMRLAETQEAAGRPPEGEMAAVVKAVNEGRDMFTNAAGEQESLRMSEGRWRGIVGAQPGVNMNTAMLMLRSPAGQREYVAKYRLDEITRRSQVDEVRMIGSQAMNEAAQGVLSGTVGDANRRNRMAEIAANAMAQAATDMTPETRGDAAARNQFMIDATRARMMEQFRSENMTEDQARTEFNRMFPEQQLGAMMAAGWGRAQERFARDPRLQHYGGENGWIRALDANNRLVTARQQFLKQEDQAQVAIGTALGGLGSASWIARAMDEVQSPSASIGEAVKKVLGGVDPDVVRRKLAAIDPNLVEAAGGLGTKERLALMTEEMLVTTRQYDTARNDPTASKERKLAAAEEYSRRINAITQGGGAARAQIKRDLVAAGIVLADADDATVLDAVRQIRTGDTKDEKIKNLPQADKDRILRYSVMGATASDEAIKRQQDEILKGEVDATRITEKELALARAGDPTVSAKLSDDARERLRQLDVTRRGLAGAAASEGMNLGAQVGEKQLASIEGKRTLLERDVAKGLPGAGPERDAAIATRRRRAEGVLDAQRRWFDTLLGDTEGMRNLGKGGVDLVSGAMGKVKDMDRLAEGLPVTVADIISDVPIDTSKMTAEQQAAVAKIKALYGEVKTDTGKMLAMSRRKPGKEGDMTPEELTRLADIQAKAKQTDEEKSKALVTDIAKGMGKTVTAEEQAQLAQTIGRGPEAEKLRYALSQRFAARADLQKLAESRGLTIEQLRTDVDTGSGVARFFGLGKITGEEAEKAKGLFEKAGAAAEDSTLQAITDSIEQEKQEKVIKAEAASKAASGAPGGKMAMSGKVMVDIQNGTMDMSGAHGQMGSTPVAG